MHKVFLRLPDSWSNWNLEMLVFEERGRPDRVPGEKLLGAKERTNNKHCSLTLSQGVSIEEVAPLGLEAGINFIVNGGGGGGITKFYFVTKS